MVQKRVHGCARNPAEKGTADYPAGPQGDRVVQSPKPALSNTHEHRAGRLRRGAPEQ